MSPELALRIVAGVAGFALSSAFMWIGFWNVAIGFTQLARKRVGSGQMAMGVCLLFTGLVLASFVLEPDLSPFAKGRVALLETDPLLAWLLVMVGAIWLLNHRTGGALLGVQVAILGAVSIALIAGLLDLMRNGLDPFTVIVVGGLLLTLPLALKSVWTSRGKGQGPARRGSS